MASRKPVAPSAQPAAQLETQLAETKPPTSVPKDRAALPLSEATLQRMQTTMGNRQTSQLLTQSANRPPVATIIQAYRCTGEYLSAALGQKNVSELRARIGQPAFEYFLTLDTADFSPLIDAFAGQSPILNAAQQTAFLSPYAGNSANLKLAIKALQIAQYAPQNAPGFYAFLAKYAAIGQPALDDAKQRVERSGLCCCHPFLKLLDRWLDRIANYFLNHATSGFVEGLNTKLKVIKRRCYGQQNVSRLFQRLTLDFDGYRRFSPWRQSAI